jgi:hypothetical protein
VLFDLTSDPTFNWLTQGGSLGILALIVIGFKVGWIVPGWAYKELRKDLEDARVELQKQGEIAQRALEAAVRKSGGS